MRLVLDDQWRLQHDGRSIDVITDSQFAAAEIGRHLPVVVRPITPISHGWKGSVDERCAVYHRALKPEVG